MKKVGLVTCYFKHNYGSSLQAYATQSFLDANKIECETVNVSTLADFSKGKRRFYIKNAFDFRFVKEKWGMLSLKIRRKFDRTLGRKLSLRDECFRRFERNFRLTRNFNSYAELSEYSSRFSSVVVGSDQLWLPVNVVSGYYTLGWAKGGVKRVSYATSFGFSYVSDKYKKTYADFLSEMDVISVREDNAVRLIESEFSLKATKVCDPTLLLSRQEWEQVASKEKKYSEKYIFCYFLGKNPSHIAFAKRLSEKTGCKIVSINNCDVFDPKADENADYAPYDVGPAEWLSLIRDAEYVCTDSFHGTVFSMIFSRKFFTFERFSSKAKTSTNSRIYSLLDEFGARDRLFRGDEDISAALSMPIDYDEIHSRIKSVREESSKFFLDSLDYRKTPAVTVADLDSEECCGCGACENACPFGAIVTNADEEGFARPIIDSALCIKCGKCVRACPVLTPKPPITYEKTAYIVQNTDEKILAVSTSGGAFSAFAKAILSSGGVVFGAAIIDGKVKHVKVEDEEGLAALRGSKYAQSETGLIFREVKAELDDGKTVLFSGTPCQVAGLYGYLGKDYDNLYTVDFVCHAVPSPAVFAAYSRIFEEKFGKPLFNFRDKSFYGYDYSHLSVSHKGKVVYHGGTESDAYMKLFFKGISTRFSCAACKFKNSRRLSAITIWDCFVAIDFDKSFDDNRGAGNVLVNSESGARLFEMAKKNLRFIEVDVEKILRKSKEYFFSSPISPRRNAFMRDLRLLEPCKLFRKYGKAGLKGKLSYAAKVILIKTHLYSKLKSRKMAKSQ
jgi:coenzyme F420-reducing hydrogenase beta subunit